MSARAKAAPTSTPSPFHGELLDADGHLYLNWDDSKEVYGPNPRGVANAFLRDYVHTEEFKANRAKNRQPESLWAIKGMGALGAYDPIERRDALTAMGVKAQLLFANNGNWELMADTDEARAICMRYNDHIVEVTQRSDNRARAACHINMSDPRWAVGEVERVLKKGAKCVLLPCHQAPGGVSPSHQCWDPLWARLQEADVPATLHLGLSGGLLSDRGPETLMFPNPNWSDSATLRNKPAFRAGGEEAISPYYMLVTHMAPELFMQTMVMGKVFERFPRLRFGIIELGAAWVGPAVERMDLWANFMNKIGVKYDLKPSEYVRRNIRVTPFWHEDLPLMIGRYGLKEIYCFSTDYPHIEGSYDPIGKFNKHLAKLDPAYARDFFIENGRWLLPNA
ncbi:MAG TPA: amidohydrolase family protein [Burkholderiales bacterium]|nr:amidohydrolase family protein [Burkholderiales bacterium]